MGHRCFRRGLCVLSFSIVDLGSLQSSCQNTKCQIAALKSRGTSWCPRKEKHLVLGLITSAPRLQSFDPSQASSIEPDWKLERTAMLITALQIIFNIVKWPLTIWLKNVITKKFNPKAAGPVWFLDNKPVIYQFFSQYLPNSVAVYRQTCSVIQSSKGRMSLLYSKIDFQKSIGVTVMNSQRLRPPHW